MKLSFYILAVSTLIVSASQAEAGSPASNAFVANVRQHIGFLTAAGELAQQRASTDKLRAFAQTEAKKQRPVLAELPGAEPTSLPQTGSLTVVASTAGATTPASADGILTGRSAAVDPTVGAADPGVLMASPGVVVMPRLAALGGESFDTLYRATQGASLKQLLDDYKAYSLTGDDPALRALAIRELPVVQSQLDALNRL